MNRRFTRTDLVLAHSTVFWFGVLLAVLLGGCATGGQTPPQSQIPWDPGLITKSRPAEANRWAADVDNRRFVEPYMNAICAPDGPWAKRNKTWQLTQADEWQKLWTFQPIPNAAPSGSAVDWSKLVEILVGIGSKVIDVALVAPPRNLLPPGLPPC